MLVVLLAVQHQAIAQTHFSQRDGFAHWREPQRNIAHTATASGRLLLQRYRPRFMLPAKYAGLIDFYADYMANGELQLGDGLVIQAPIDGATLNEHQCEPLATFAHRRLVHTANARCGRCTRGAMRYSSPLTAYSAR